MFTEKILTRGSRKKPQPEYSLEKGVPSLKQLLAPDAVTFHEDYLKINSMYARIFAIKEYPRDIPLGWLERIYGLGDVDVSIHVVPAKGRDVAEWLTEKISRLMAQVTLYRKQGDDRNVDIYGSAVEDLRRLRLEIQSNRERMYYTTTLIMLWAAGLEELESRTETMRDIFAEMNIQERVLVYRQKEGFISMLPLCENKVYKYYVNTPVGATAAMQPFVNPKFTHPSGIHFGDNMYTGTPVFWDRFIGFPVLNNPHLVLLGMSGIGKTTTVKKIAGQSALQMIRTAIIDPDGEYRIMFDKLGGTYVTLDPDGEALINPFDIEEDDYEGGVKVISKAAEIRLLVDTMVRIVDEEGKGLNASETAVVEETAREEYEALKITGDPASLYEEGTPKDENGRYSVAPKKKAMPTFSSFYERLTKKPGSERLAVTLRQYLAGGVKGMFDGQTRVDLKDTLLIGFDFSRITDPMLISYACHVVLSWLWDRFAKKDPRTKKAIVIEEYSHFTKIKSAAQFAEDVARRGRRRNCALTVSTQLVQELIENPHGKAIIDNCDSVFLMKQNTSCLDLIQEVFKLSNGQKTFIETAGAGEGLLLTGRHLAAVSVPLSAFEKEYTESDPNRRKW